MKNIIISKLKRSILLRKLYYPIVSLRQYIHKKTHKKNYFFRDLFSNVYQGSLIVQIKNIDGQFEIDARSDLLQRILIDKEYEPETIRHVKDSINIYKDALNIGANCGIFTVLMAQLIGERQKVLAVEPTALAFNYLQKNIERNSKQYKVILFNGLCTNIKGTNSINFIEGSEEYSSLGDSYFTSDKKEKIKKVEVPGETIDNLVREYQLHPGFVLIDVEGAEMKVLQGATEMIEFYKPVIILEVDNQLLTNQGSSSDEVLEFISSKGYRIENVLNEKSISSPFTGSIIAFPV
jgi:FkbM family methyltransferase